MLIARYAHRLPADYDLEIIRQRAEARGPQWDAVPELYFKAFLLRESGRFGASTSLYSSLYLWRQNEPFRDFLAARADAPINSFTAVTGSFGRPQIRTWLPLDARKGPARQARFVHAEELDVVPDADLPKVFADEAERNRKAADHPDAVAAAVGVDTLNWKLIRILLSRAEPIGNEGGVAYQILYLAQPLLDTLP